jgi:hypothetical protein
VIRINAVMAENEHQGTFEVDRLPDECPICKKGNEFVARYAFYKGPTSSGFDSRLQVVFRCPRQDCQVMFFAFYNNQYERPPHNWFFNRFGLIKSVEKVEFPETISVISERFTRIYEQAEMADANGLDEISGPGYGKALEVLIKDYLIYLYPEQSDEIKKQLRLALLIDQIGDGDIQIVADRASWLRNDEIHYEKKWKEEDVHTLKDLIELTVSHIKRAEMTKKYKEKMPDPKESKENTAKK